MFALGREQVLPAALGRTGRNNIPKTASLTQSATAPAVIGQDPMAKLFFWLGPPTAWASCFWPAGVWSMGFCFWVHLVVFGSGQRQASSFPGQMNHDRTCAIRARTRALVASGSGSCGCWRLDAASAVGHCS